MPNSEEHFVENTSKEQENQRTDRQNRALHLYFQMVADELNAAGLDMRAVLKPEFEIPWMKETIKEFIWRPVQILQIGKKSTTELTTAEIDKVFDTVNLHLAKHGIHVPWPSLESEDFE